MAEREYLEAAGVENAFAKAVATVLKERPDNVLGRLANLISPAPVAAETYLETVGNTPLVKLNKCLPTEAKANVYAKFEMQNPGGSIKDRIARGIIEGAEKAGKLKPGMTIVEATSGNTGIAVAMVCAQRGYDCVICMAEPFSVERRKLMRMCGTRAQTANFRLAPA